ncbi:30S ribosomal protein S8 [Candidatus Woesearchaeota archaeon]|nr:30S ribosomal protein S8 [Candidatus Woesearchaeota archaeon]
MSLNDPLASILSQINNAKRVGKQRVTTKMSSNVIKKVLAIMSNQGYIGAVEEVIDAKGNYLIINLIGHLNACGVVKPRFAIKIDDYEKFEKSYLPARGFGILIVSTNQGLMVHTEAKEKGVGGRLISYCY